MGLAREAECLRMLIVISGSVRCTPPAKSVTFAHLTTLRAGSVILEKYLAPCLVAPRLTMVTVDLNGGETVAAIIPWLSIQSIRMVDTNWNRLPVMILGSVLDALLCLATLYLPPKMAWTDDLVPTLPHVKHLVAPDTVFATLPNFALPTLEHAECAEQEIYIQKLPSACMHTLKQITAGTIHVQLVTALSCAPRLKYFLYANRIGIDGAFTLAEWRLAYMQGNPIWRLIPSLTVRLDAANKPVRKFVVEVRTVDDVGKWSRKSRL
ncbi:hypothetical protein GGF31_006756 [Allomyces arbusculus]|nr:hypothetical protein GGF31_006756 [Allomyces arbusculus]